MKFILTALIASILAFGSIDVNATNTECPAGQVKKEVSGNWKCVDVVPTTTTPPDLSQNQEQNQQQQQDQNQHQNATGTGTGVGLGVGVGLGGEGGNSVSNASGGAGGNAQGGRSDSTSSATGGTSLSSASGGSIDRSGNSRNDNANSNLNANNVASDNRNNNSLSNTGGNSTNTLSNGSNSGGNSLSNGSASTSGASNGDQSTSVSNTNGGNTTASVASADGSGNSDTQVTIDSSDRSVREGDVSQALFISTIQAAPPSIVAGATAIVDRGVCGPRQGLVTEDVNGIYIGMFSQRKVYLGKSDRLVSIEGQKFLVDRGQDGVTRLIGQRPVSYIAVIGVAGSRSIGVGGGKTGGDWGQVGASGGSSMQRMVVQTNLEDCEYAHTAPAPVIIEVRKRIAE